MLEEPSTLVESAVWLERTTKTHWHCYKNKVFLILYDILTNKITLFSLFETVLYLQ